MGVLFPRARIPARARRAPPGAPGLGCARCPSAMVFPGTPGGVRMTDAHALPALPIRDRDDRPTTRLSLPLLLGRWRRDVPTAADGTCPPLSPATCSREAASGPRSVGTSTAAGPAPGQA